MNDWFGMIAASVMLLFIGFVIGVLTHKSLNESVRERTMVEFNLAHYDEKTREFIADSLEFKNDTIIIRKKAN